MTAHVSPVITLNAGVLLPAVGFGVFQSAPEDAIDAVGTALARGYRLIDTAAAYFNEREVGEAIRRSGIARTELFVRTKLWISEHQNDSGLTRRALEVRRRLGSEEITQVRRERHSKAGRSSLLATAALASLLGTAAKGTAQPLREVKTPDTPLVLKAQGSFFVGGEKVEQTQVELGDLGPGGHITVNQMYVRYMVPQGGDGNVPVVMVHGATLTGKSWETTPDGRMGWDEYFVRKGHPVYVPDQVGRGRSGFNQAVFNGVRAGSVPPANLPRWIRFSDEVVWPNFRFGSKADAPYADTQFPLTALDEMSKQGVPDVSFGGLPNPNPTFKALADLAGEVNGAVLMGHSQSGSFPLAAALLNPSAVRGLVLVEPGACPGNYTDEQIKTLATLPVLAVFGDHRDTPTGIGIRPSWQLSFEGCQALITRLKAAGGQAQMLSPAEIGVRGNSHMIMQDKNNLQIADLILKWIDERVSKPTGAAK